MYINCELEVDSYRRLKTTTQEEIQRVQGSLAQLKGVDTHFMKYCRWGLTLLTHLSTFFEKATTAVKKKDSWFDIHGKIDFREWKISNHGA